MKKVSGFAREEHIPYPSSYLPEVQRVIHHVAQSGQNKVWLIEDKKGLMTIRSYGDTIPFFFTSERAAIDFRSQYDSQLKSHTDLSIFSYTTENFCRKVLPSVRDQFDAILIDPQPQNLLMGGSFFSFKEVQ
jgi:hypothetical protein